MNKRFTIDLSTVADRLEKTGLNLCAAFSAVSLADSMPELVLPGRSDHLLMVGNVGADLWQHLPQDTISNTHPVDTYTWECITQVLGDYLPAAHWQILYPNSISKDSQTNESSAAARPISLQELGALAGWHHPSPLGIGVNAKHGLWFAYRALVAVEADITGIEPIAAPSAESPCLSCADTPCLTQCPAGALTLGQNPDLAACVAHRLSENSACERTCVARLACPVGVEYKYSEDQISYFYDRSLTSVKRWAEQITKTTNKDA